MTGQCLKDESQAKTIAGEKINRGNGWVDSALFCHSNWPPRENSSSDFTSGALRHIHNTKQEEHVGREASHQCQKKKEPGQVGALNKANSRAWGKNFSIGAFVRRGFK